MAQKGDNANQRLIKSDGLRFGSCHIYIIPAFGTELLLFFLAVCSVLSSECLNSVDDFQSRCSRLCDTCDGARKDCVKSVEDISSTTIRPKVFWNMESSRSGPRTSIVVTRFN